MSKLPLAPGDSGISPKGTRSKLTTKNIVRYSLLIFVILLVVHGALFVYAVASGDTISVGRSQVKQPNSYKMSYVYSNENYASNFTIEEERLVSIRVRTLRGEVDTRITTKPVELTEEVPPEDLVIRTQGEEGIVFQEMLPPGTYYMDMYCQGHSGSVEVIF